jgi:sirohydrochlorin cobaltochelatase
MRSARRLPGSTLAMPSSTDTPGSTLDILLLATAEPCEAHAELTARLSRRMGVEARVVSFGTRSGSELAGVLARAGARVVVVPLSTSSSDPLLTELAGLLRWARARWPEVPLLQSEPIGAATHVVGWAAQQVRAALAAQGEPALAAETAVLVVGPGGTSPEMNAEVCALARLLWERGDYALVEPAFVRDAGPASVAARIAHCHQPGVRRVVVAPLALLEGAAVRAVRSCVRAAGAEEIVVAGPLLSPGAAAAIVRQRFGDAVARWLATGQDGPALSHGHDHGAPAEPAVDDLLPPRYRGRSASAVPMRSAPLRHDAEGRVAWDTVWQSFCDLALAGGPPHRGTLLEPALREEVQTEPSAYARVVAEIARALALVTRLPVVTDGAPGWVGLVCPEEEMAIWMLRAITVENVSVRREGATLFLPAGPAYRVEKEIKNVVTAVAKTHHYWTEHRAAR